MDLQRSREPEFPGLVAQVAAQHFVPSVRGIRLRLAPHCYKRLEAIDARLEALP